MNSINTIALSEALGSSVLEFTYRKKRSPWSSYLWNFRYYSTIFRYTKITVSQVNHRDLKRILFRLRAAEYRVRLGGSTASNHRRVTEGTFLCSSGALRFHHSQTKDPETSLIAASISVEAVVAETVVKFASTVSVGLKNPKKLGDPVNISVQFLEVKEYFVSYHSFA